MSHVHWLRHIWRTEINNDRARGFGFVVEEMFTACGCLQHTCQRSGPEAEIEKASPRDFDAFAPLADIQMGEHVSGELAWIHFPLLRKRHQDAALIIPEFWIWTG